MPEPVAFNINFSEQGLESTLFIENIGSCLLMIMLYILLAIMCLFLYNVKSIWNKLGPKLYWNGLIRLFLELYQDLALLSFLNLYTAEWDSVYDYVCYSNNLSAAVFTVVLAVPLILAVVMFRMRN